MALIYKQTWHPSREVETIKKEMGILELKSLIIGLKIPWIGRLEVPEE